ncbi:MAG: hypothetical protein ACP5F8_01720 [Candidatus Aenigmatarchaeota archaeon]
MKKILIILFFLLFIARPSFSQYSIGVSPSIIDLGTIEPGNTQRVKFYIVSPSNEEILVNLKEEPGSLDFILSRYPQTISNYSEEDASKWVRYFSNPVVLKPQLEPLNTPIGKVSNWREIEFLLSIPKNAEPGYHSFAILPEPQFVSQARGQVSVGIVALTKVNVIFRIPGEVLRKGEILEVLGEGNKVKVYFKNTGNVSMSVRINGEIYDGNNTYSFSSPISIVKPDEMKEFIAFLPKDFEGSYEAKIFADYTSEKIEKKLIINFAYKPVQIQKPIDFSFLIYLLIGIIIIILAKWFYEKV